jgi:hypothetical protein
LIEKTDTATTTTTDTDDLNVMIVFELPEKGN